MMQDIRFLREWKIRKNYRDKYYFYSMTLDSLVRNCRLVRADSISLGFLINALAIAIFCLSPPLNSLG